MKHLPFGMFVLTALLVLGLLGESVLFRKKENVSRIAVLTDSLWQR